MSRSSRLSAARAVSISASTTGSFTPERLKVARGVDALRSEERAELDRGCQRQVEAGGDDVVVEIFLALLHLCGIDEGEFGLDAEAAEILDIGQHDALEGRPVVEELDGELAAIRVAPRAVGPDRPAGLVEKGAGGGDEAAVGVLGSLLARGADTAGFGEDAFPAQRFARLGASM